MDEDLLVATPVSTPITTTTKGKCLGIRYIGVKGTKSIT